MSVNWTKSELIEIEEVLSKVDLTKITKAELDALYQKLAGRKRHPIWNPLPGPQQAAYDCLADELFYGGAAGGGKSDLLLGLSVTQHKKTVFLRRQAMDLGAAVDRVKEILGKNPYHFKSIGPYGGVLTTGENRITVFEGCKDEKDKESFQGKACDLYCVAKGTPILMGDGSYKNIESIQVGDKVSTLDGPKTITRTFPPQRKKAIRMNIIDSYGNIIGSQIQSEDHRILTNYGWKSYKQYCFLDKYIGQSIFQFSISEKFQSTFSPSSPNSKYPILFSDLLFLGSEYKDQLNVENKDVMPHKKYPNLLLKWLHSLFFEEIQKLVQKKPLIDKLFSRCTFYESLLFWVYNSIESLDLYKFFEQCVSQFLSWKQLPRQSSQFWNTFLSSSLFLYPNLRISSDTSLLFWEIDYVKSVNDNQLISQQQLFSQSFLKQLQPYSLLFLPFVSLLFQQNEFSHVENELILEDYLDHYLNDSHPHDGQLLFFPFSPCNQKVFSPIYPLLLKDVEQSIPNVLENQKSLDNIHECTPHKFLYPHPYKKEIHSTYIDFDLDASYSLTFEPLGEQELYDLTVEDVCHYITKVGKKLPNSNCFDELSHFSKSMYRFIIGWNRSSIPNQRCRVVAAGNPPTTPEGAWVVEEWAPWLDTHFGNPAVPGELRWYSTIDGRLEWLEDDKEFKWKGELIRPKSRTFIPALLKDNPILERSGYLTTLQAVEEPYRSQLIYGDMSIGNEDHEWQIIPTEWVTRAMDRWKEMIEPTDIPFSQFGVDAARGGKDKMVISKRRETWFAPLVVYPGKHVEDGPKAAGLIQKEIPQEITQKNDASLVPLINVDIVNVGGSVVDFLRILYGKNKVYGFNGASRDGIKDNKDRTKTLGFLNLRAAAYWAMRRSLDPTEKLGIALPPDPELKADLTAARFKVGLKGIQVEDKQEIIKRLGRSPDKGDAVVMCNWIPKFKKLWVL